MKKIFILSCLFILVTNIYAQSSDALNSVFEEASYLYNIPIDVIKAVAYTETRYFHHVPTEETKSCTNMPPGYGVMGLHDDYWFGHSLLLAANLVGENPERLKQDYRLNIIGAAALLNQIANDYRINRSNINDWKPVFEQYSGIPQDNVKDYYSFDVLKALSDGVELNGISIAKHYDVDLKVFRKEVYPEHTLQNIMSDDYPPAVWDPSPNFYSTGTFTKQFSVVHDTEGSFAASLSWLKNPSASASAHYIFRSSDGYLVQLVREQYAAWHAVCWNRYMFGTEHEGYVANPAFFTDTMYLNSAALFRHLCLTYNIPMNLNHIIGHDAKKNASWVTYIQNNYPFDPNCNTHTDPGQYWDWNFYLQLIKQDTISPNVTEHTPNTTDSVWANAQIRITFDQKMRRPETQNAFVISPNVPGTFSWENSGKTMVFTPSTLMQLGTTYTVTLNTNAVNFLYRPILGNYSFQFVTKATSVLNMLSVYPANNQTNISSSVKVIATFNSPLLQSSVAGNVTFQDSAGNNIAMKNAVVKDQNGKGIIMFSPQNNLINNNLYKITFKSGLKNIVGSPLGSDYEVNFRIEPNNFYPGTLVDGFEAMGNWKTPTYSGSTTGVDASKTTFSISSEEKVHGSYSGKLTYAFVNASGGVCREFNADKPNIGGVATDRFGMWVYGDLSYNTLEFWFYYNSSTNSIVTIGSLDWSGWKFIEIPISSISGSGDRLFHSIVIKQTTNGIPYDSIYVDLAQKRDPLATEVINVENIAPKTFKLEQNYPNPFNPSTTIRFQIPSDGFVTLKLYDILGNEVAVLLNEDMKAGFYAADLNSNEYHLSSGVYFYKLISGNYSDTKKLVLLK